jgi:fructuronate reductase
MRYVTGIDEAGQPIDVKDPLAARLRAIADEAGRDPVKLADGLLAVTEVFGADLPQVAVFRDTVTNHLKSLLENGAKEAVQRLS